MLKICNLLISFFGLSNACGSKETQEEKVLSLTKSEQPNFSLQKDSSFNNLSNELNKKNQLSDQKRVEASETNHLPDENDINEECERIFSSQNEFNIENILNSIY